MNVLRVGFVWALGIAGAMLLLAAFAGLRPGVPWSPADALNIPLDRLQSPTSKLEWVDDTLRISGAAADGSVFLQHLLEQPFSAERFRYLRIQLVGANPGTRGFLWLRSDGQERILQLPGGLRGTTRLDLAANVGWQGTIEAIGLGFLPTEYLSPIYAKQPSLSLRQMSFASINANDSIGTLVDRWFSYRPWNGRSNHTGGFEHGPDPGPSLQGWLALIIVWVSAITLWAARKQGKFMIVWWTAVAVALLGTVQVVQLGMRAEAALLASIATPVDDQRTLSAMPAMAGEVNQLERLWRVRHPDRVIVWGATGFMREYPTWLLREFNAASLYSPEQLAHLRSDERNAVLVLGGKEGWNYDEQRAELRVGETILSASRSYDGAILHVFHLKPGAVP